jgi:hypothetical protein
MTLSSSVPLLEISFIDRENKSEARSALQLSAHNRRKIPPSKKILCMPKAMAGSTAKMVTRCGGAASAEDLSSRSVPGEDHSHFAGRLRKRGRPFDAVKPILLVVEEGLERPFRLTRPRTSWITTM